MNTLWMGYHFPHTKCLDNTAMVLQSTQRKQMVYRLLAGLEQSENQGTVLPLRLLFPNGDYVIDRFQCPVIQ